MSAVAVFAVWASATAVLAQIATVEFESASSGASSVRESGRRYPQELPPQRCGPRALCSRPNRSNCLIPRLVLRLRLAVFLCHRRGASEIPCCRQRPLCRSLHCWRGADIEGAIGAVHNDRQWFDRRGDWAGVHSHACVVVANQSRSSNHKSAGGLRPAPRSRYLAAG
jgi:hypothetical protein